MRRKITSKMKSERPEEKYIDKVMKKTGWTREKAIDHMEKAIERGVSYKKYVFMKKWLTSNKDKANKTSKEYDIAFKNYVNKEYWKLSDLNREIFCDDVVEFDNKSVTLRKMCKYLGVELPEEYEDIADEPQTVAFRSKRVRPGDICLIIRSAEDFEIKSLTTKDQYELAIEKGAKLIIMGKKDFEKYNLKKENFPVILIDNNNERILRLFSIIRRQQKAKVVMITGSVGKTTTKDLCYTVAKNRLKTFANPRNTNTVHQVAKHLFYKTYDSNEVYIQETGAGYKGSVRFSASMLQPDIFILTNIYKHHLQVYKTLDCLLDDKVSADDYLSENGVIITNYDDENIRNHKFKHSVKSFAVNNEDADYRAVNIRQSQGALCLDIYEKETGETTGVSVKILGEHNAYNILAAFVLGKTLGLSNDEIKEDLSEYRPGGVRQNLSNIGGVHINLDCYNVAEESIISMLRAGEKFELEEGGRKIAVLGGENKLGKNVRERSLDFGAEVAKIKMDKYLFCGTVDTDRKTLNKYGDAASIRKGFMNACDTPNQFSTSVDDIVDFLKNNVKRNDLVMFKGIYYLDMPIAVDKVFGTSFSFKLSNYKENMKRISGSGYKCNLIEEFNELELFNAPVNGGKVIIPEVIKEYQVFRIKEGSFKGKSDISEIDFGKSVKNIGAEAFYGCNGLKELIIPSNVKVIESDAFSNCGNLESVVLQQGVTHISHKAFAGCKKLEKVYIPSTVGMIEEHAFEDCDKLVIICEKDSFAYGYAMDNDISFKIQEK